MNYTRAHLAVRLVRIRGSEIIGLERRTTASGEESARGRERQTIRKLRICRIISAAVQYTFPIQLRTKVGLSTGLGQGLVVQAAWNRPI